MFFETISLSDPCNVIPFYAMKKRNRSEYGLVYSTESGRICPQCNTAKEKCRCRVQTTADHNDGIVRISRQTKGRKGSGVSLISGVPLPGQELKTLAKKLKQRCGTGGTVKNGVIEIQGDHRQVLQAALEQMGYKVKQAGG